MCKTMHSYDEYIIRNNFKKNRIRKIFDFSLWFWKVLVFLSWKKIQKIMSFL